MYKNLVLSGGSIKAVAFIGCIQYLEEHDMLSSIMTYVGSSAGAIFCFLVVMGYTSAEIAVLIKEALKDYQDYNVDIDRILDVYENAGIDNGEFFTQMIAKWISHKYKASDITFMDIAKLTGKNLVICSSDIANREEFYFSLDTTPNTSVIFALRASIALPLIFEPVKMSDDRGMDRIFVDAGLFNNFPIDYVRKSLPRDTLGVEMTYVPSTPSKLNLMSYVNLIINAVFDKLNKKIVGETESMDIVLVSDKFNDSYCFDMSTLKFSIDSCSLFRYIDHGYDSIVDFFKSKSS